MKTLIKITIICVLVLLFGAFPIQLLAKIFEWTSGALTTLADWIDFFGWGGILK